MTTLQKALDLLTPQERRRGSFVLILVGAMGLFEMVGVVSVVPFLSVLANPEMVQSNDVLSWLYEYFQLTTIDEFLFFLGALAFVLLIFAAVIRSIGLYAVIRFAQMRRHSIGARLLELHLRQPYEFFIGRHSGDLAKGILSEVDQVVTGVYQPTATMIAQCFTLISIVVLLVLIDPWVAFAAGFALGAIYGVIFFFIRTFLNRMGKSQIERNKQRFEAITEALGGIKVIKVMGRENAYLQRFWKPSQDVSHYMSVNQVLAQVPKFAIEVIAFGGILFLALILMVRYGGHEENALGQVLPLLGLYALAGYRMLPAIQSIYSAFSQVRFWSSAVDNLHKDLCSKEKLPDLERRPVLPLNFQDKIRLESLSYSYPNADGIGVKDITLEISAGSSIGIVGSTGSGKTTLADLILGLLKPVSGHLCVDETVITEDKLRNWQANIGYVPQDIFLIDATIEANIAMGIMSEEIDHLRVRECARMAAAHQFIEEELPKGYESEIGERGVRLSGGQKQRIGIARALYHDPDFIVFDEATSALDTLTEKKVMKALIEFSGTKTLVMIAHRLSTLEACDQILVLKKGRMVGLGSYAELNATNPTFKQIVNASSKD